MDLFPVIAQALAALQKKYDALLNSYTAVDRKLSNHQHASKVFYIETLDLKAEIARLKAENALLKSNDPK